MTTQPVLGLLYMLNTLRAQGFDLAPVLASYGLSEAQLAPGARIDRTLELRLLCDLAGRLPRADLGLTLGQGFGFTGYGPFSFLLLTCANAYEALQCGLRYQQLTFLFSPLSFVPGERESALCLTPLELPEPGRRFLVDVEMAGTYKLLLDLQNNLGLSLRAVRVEVPYPAPADCRPYESYYGCPVSFGSEQVRFWIANEHLQLKLPTADPTAHAYYRGQCDERLAQQLQEQRGGDVVTQVRQHLALYSQGYPDAGQVAAALGLAERTLRHQLSAAGSSYRQLLDETRFSRARQLLVGGGQSVEQVALALGYAEAAAFIHAFQRWAGCTPAAWRRQQTAAE